MKKVTTTCPECKKEGTIICSVSNNIYLVICLLHNCSFKKVFVTEEEMSEYYQKEIEKKE